MNHGAKPSINNQCIRGHSARTNNHQHISNSTITTLLLKIILQEDDERGGENISHFVIGCTCGRSMRDPSRRTRRKADDRQRWVGAERCRFTLLVAAAIGKRDAAEAPQHEPGTKAHQPTSTKGSTHFCIALINNYTQCHKQRSYYLPSYLSHTGRPPSTLFIQTLRQQTPETIQ